MPLRLPFRPAWAVCLSLGSVAEAHGIAGNRFFPGTLTFDDPAVADELILPNFSAQTYPAGIGNTVHEATYGLSFGRLLTPDLAFQVDSGWTQRTRPNQPRERGLDATVVGLKARVFENDPHEELVSVSLGWGLPNFGSAAVGASGSSTFQPALFVGKGFGNLPDSLSWLRPFGVAGGLLAELPTRRTPATNPNMLHWGVALEYSTLYLTDRFTGGPPQEEPLRQWVPLVEFAVDTPLGGSRRQVTTANPGISYVAVTWQIAAEAIVPLDDGAGSHVGGRIQLLMFLDDLLPSLFGRPLLSEHPLFRSSD